MDYRIITAPVIIPDQYDCDQDKGEPPLTRQQIRNLKETFDKDYGFIDYDHKLLDTRSPWYMKLVGEPVRSWITRKETAYKNVLGETETIPVGTWWLTSKVTDPTMIKHIDEKLVTAYSITVGNRSFCDDMKHVIQTAPKNNKEISLPDVDGQIASKHKTLIRDIKDPVGFTVSLTGLPCVGSATFSQTCYEKQNKHILSHKNGGTNMEETNENRFSISELLGIKELFANKKDTEGNEEEAPAEKPAEKEPEQEKEFVTKEEFTEAIDETNKKIGDLEGKVDKILEKLDEEPEEEEEEKEGGAKPEEEEKPTANKNNNPPEPSSQLDNTDDGNNQNTANKNNNNGSTKAKLMKELNRKPNGDFKFPKY